MFLVKLVYALLKLVFFTILYQRVFRGIVLFVVGLVAGVKDTAPVLYAEYKGDVASAMKSQASSDVKRGKAAVDNAAVSLAEWIEAKRAV